MSTPTVRLTGAMLLDVPPLAATGPTRVTGALMVDVPDIVAQLAALTAAVQAVATKLDALATSAAAGGALVA